MSYKLKEISREGVPAALAKAERYRLLNEPGEAESICRDVLRVDPESQAARVMLLLALTDQFGKETGELFREAREVASGLRSEYQQRYYAGVVCERWAKAHVGEGEPGHVAHGWIRQAMEWYEKAENLRAQGNEEAALRWNACVRLLERNPFLQPRAAEEAEEPGADEEVPLI